MNKVQQFAAETADAYLSMEKCAALDAQLSLPARQSLDKVWTETAADVLRVAMENIRQPALPMYDVIGDNRMGYRLGDVHPVPVKFPYGWDKV